MSHHGQPKRSMHSLQVALQTFCALQKVCFRSTGDDFEDKRILGWGRRSEIVRSPKRCDLVPDLIVGSPAHDRVVGTR